MSVEKTLEERGTRYGEFENHASISDELQRVCVAGANRNPNYILEAIHREAIRMICHKLARILNGDPNYIDTWHDIAGYATLVEQYLEKNKAKKVILTPTSHHGQNCTCSLCQQLSGKIK